MIEGWSLISCEAVCVCGGAVYGTVAVTASAKGHGDGGSSQTAANKAGECAALSERSQCRPLYMVLESQGVYQEQNKRQTCVCVHCSVESPVYS